MGHSGRCSFRAGNRSRATPILREQLTCRRRRARRDRRIHYQIGVDPSARGGSAKSRKRRTQTNVWRLGMRALNMSTVAERHTVTVEIRPDEGPCSGPRIGSRQPSVRTLSRISCKRPRRGVRMSRKTIVDDSFRIAPLRRFTLSLLHFERPRWLSTRR
jgi:hypothetical protein